MNNKNNFYYLRFLTITSVGPMINEPTRATKIFTRVLDLSSPLNVEVIN